METPGEIYHFDKNFGLTTRLFGDVLLYQIGELCCETGFVVSQHKQWCYEITYVKTGEGTMFTNGKPSIVRTGDLYISSRHCMHSIMANRGCQLRYLYMGFDVPNAEQKEPGLWQVLKYFDETTENCLRDNAGVGEMLDKTVKEFGCEQECFDEVVTASLKMLMYLTYRNARLNAPTLGKRSVSDDNVGMTVYLIIRYVDDHICETGSIRDLAEKLNYNYSYISHLFKTRVGVTLQSYIIKKKMEKATEFLCADRLTVTETSERLGYQSVQAFSKVFHSIYGVTPTLYLKEQNQEEIV